MDLSFHGRILIRYWRLVVAGVAIAFALAILAVAQPARDGVMPTLAYRSNEVWQSQATLLLTTPGFPEGRLNSSADPGRFLLLSDLYAQLATSDGVRKILNRDGPVNGAISAVVLRPSSNVASPLIQMIGKAPSASKSQALTKRATDAFIRYLALRQQEAGIRPGNRVQVSIIRRVEPAALIEPRKRTLPIMVFLAVLSAAAALIYVLERVRVRPQATTRPVQVADEPPVQNTPPNEQEEELQEEERIVARRWA
jgi:hypothetical protein